MRKLFVLCIVGLLLVVQTQAWSWGSDEEKEEVKVDDDDDLGMNIFAELILRFCDIE